MSTKKNELTREEVMVEALSTLCDWKVKYTTLSNDARWKALHNFSEELKKEHLDRLYQDAAIHLEFDDYSILKRTIEKWFPEESKGVDWGYHLAIKRSNESFRKEKERGES